MKDEWWDTAGRFLRTLPRRSLEHRTARPCPPTNPPRTYDTTAVLEKLSRRKGSQNIKGVLCRASANAVVTADAVAFSLDLPRCGSSVAQSSLSKSTLCETSNQLDIPTIPIIALRDIDLTGVPFRCVVKPDMPQSGKKNVFLVDYNTLPPALIAAEAESLNSKAIINLNNYITYSSISFKLIIFFLIYQKLRDCKNL